jgi:uncharacterized membrane protein
MNLLRSDLNRNYPYNVVVRNKVVLAACAFLLFLAYLIYSSVTQAQVSCEVCIGLHQFSWQNGMWKREGR